MFYFFRSLFSRRKPEPVVGPRIPGFAIKTLKGEIANPGTQSVSGIRPSEQRLNWRDSDEWKAPGKIVHSAQMPKLVLACMGDAEKAKRLALFELSRRPGMSFDAAVSSALQRLRADRER